MALRNKKILVTCGPTWIPLDDVRVISNRSSGRMGQTIASGLAAAGARVTLLEGPVELPVASRRIRCLKFRFFDELDRLLRQELKKEYHAVIHAAAVSDYCLPRPVKGKLSSERTGLTLKLVPAKKLIAGIKRAAPRTFLVGFKLATDGRKAGMIRRAQKLFTAARCDLVLANCVRGRQYQAYIIDRQKHILASGRSREKIAADLIKVLKEQL